MPKVIIIAVSIFLVTTSACRQAKDTKLSDKDDISALSAGGDKMLNFCLDGISKDEKRRWSIQGDTVDIGSDSSIIDMTSITAKIYDQEGNATLTAEAGRFDRKKNIVYARSNVVVTNNEGVYLNTETLNWDADGKQISSDDYVSLQKDNWQISGLGALAEPDFKKVVFKQENTVLIQPDTVITCSGPLNIDYEKNLAVFKEDVIITRKKERLFSKKMNVFFDPKTKKIIKAVAIGKVRIESLY